MLQDVGTRVLHTLLERVQVSSAVMEISGRPSYPRAEWVLEGNEISLPKRRRHCGILTPVVTTAKIRTQPT